MKKLFYIKPSSHNSLQPVFSMTEHEVLVLYNLLQKTYGLIEKKYKGKRNYDDVKSTIRNIRKVLGGEATTNVDLVATTYNTIEQYKYLQGKIDTIDGKYLK